VNGWYRYEKSENTDNYVKMLGKLRMTLDERENRN
jgi:hypothetical protein